MASSQHYHGNLGKEQMADRQVGASGCPSRRDGEDSGGWVLEPRTYPDPPGVLAAKSSGTLTITWQPLPPH